MTWVLILFVGGAGFTAPAALTTVEFNSREQCERTGAAVANVISTDASGVLDVRFYCADRAK